MFHQIECAINKFISYFPEIKKNDINKSWLEFDYKSNSNNMSDLHDLQLKKKTELVKLCKKYNHKISGNKSDLIDRLHLSVETHILHCVDLFCNYYSKKNKDIYRYLYSVWDTNKASILNTIYSLSEKDKGRLEYRNLIQLSKSCLIGLCKHYNKNCKGNKDILINRLLNIKVKKKKKKNHVIFDKKSVTLKQPIIKLKSIENKLLLHPETKIVFNRNYIAIGKKDDKQIVPLKKKDCLVCKMYNFSFYIPYNLDK